jgi:hypothetical protein
MIAAHGRPVGKAAQEGRKQGEAAGALHVLVDEHRIAVRIDHHDARLPL